jgi:hypothetical protein
MQRTVPLTSMSRPTPHASQTHASFRALPAAMDRASDSANFHPRDWRIRPQQLNVPPRAAEGLEPAWKTHGDGGGRSNTFAFSPRHFEETSLKPRKHVWLLMRRTYGRKDI